MRGLNLAEALLERPPGTDTAQPLITYYDDATGERIELSAVTLANWAAKTANLLRDECDLTPEGRVAVLLPAHWQTLAVLLGVWWCGAEVVTDPAGAQVVCCTADRLGSSVESGADVVVAFSLDAFGAGLPGLPPGVLDYATEVRLFADTFVPEASLSRHAAALDGRTPEEVLAAARASAAQAGLTAGCRVLTTRDWTVADGSVANLIKVPLAVLAAGGSLVHCRNLNPATEAATLARRAETERVTHRLT